MAADEFYRRRFGMARPPKDKKDRKEFDLRIPVTADQKEMIVQAAKMQGADMAAWVRPILLQAAADLIEKGKVNPPGQAAE